MINLPSLPYSHLLAFTMPKSHETVKGSILGRRARRDQTLPRRGVYCCLIGNSLKSTIEKETFVFIASDPIHATILHNQRLTTMKETRSVAPFWHLVLVMGPFPSRLDATACAQRWANCTRGCPSKMRRGSELATEYKVPCYSCAVQPPGGTMRFLRKYAPLSFLRTFKRLMQASQPKRNVWK